MTRLYLIRHGQASFGQANYDKLSPLGEQQADLTGEFLAGRNFHIDHAIVGSLSRQQATATGVLAHLKQAPAVETRPEFNEYEPKEFFNAYLESVFAEQPELAAKRNRMSDDPRLFQKVFEHVMHKWQTSAPHDAGEIESWAAFEARVAEGLRRLRDEYDRDSRMALFSSGGAIAVCVGQCLQLMPEAIARLNWVIYNCAITELRSSREGWRLIGFNDIGHLQAQQEPGLITLR